MKEEKEKIENWRKKVAQRVFDFISNGKWKKNGNVLKKKRNEKQNER